MRRLLRELERRLLFVQRVLSLATRAAPRRLCRDCAGRVRPAIIVTKLSRLYGGCTTEERRTTASGCCSACSGWHTDCSAQTSRMRTTRTGFFLPGVLVALAACAADDAPPPPDCPTTGRYLELVPGASWRYRVTDANGVIEKIQTVGSLEDVGGTKAGVMAYRMTTTKAGGQVVSWQEDTGATVRRHKELDMAGGSQTTELYQPFRTRLDESESHVIDGAVWSESYEEIVTDAAQMTTTTPKTEQWRVGVVEEEVLVPAGAFCALRISRTSMTPGGVGSDKTFWFARGIGKVKEIGLGQTEELVSVSGL